MFVLKIIFVILLCIPLFMMAFMLLNKLFDSALKKRDKAVKRDNKRRQRRR